MTKGDASLVNWTKAELDGSRGRRCWNGIQSQNRWTERRRVVRDGKMELAVMLRCERVGKATSTG